jgi:DNA mismatch repair protein MutL
MLIDQHRAHLCVLYERYMHRMAMKQGMSQGVLFPEVIQLPASEATVLDAIFDDLSAVGFELSPLGGGSYAINGVPSGIEGLNPVELVRNMVHTALEKGFDVREEVQSLLALTLARAAAIVYGQVLTNDEMASLVGELFALPSPSYTPDGHVVLSTIKEEDIQKLF